jgi:hypothetical protein
MLDLKKLSLKQLYIRQLMNLKSKGRFLDETMHFVDTMKTMPSM